MTQITTAEELDALPVGSVVDTIAVTARKGYMGTEERWYATNGGIYRSAGLLDRNGPARLLVPAALP